jgi:hypothetical protein
MNPKVNLAASNDGLKFFKWAYEKGGKMAAELDYIPMPDNVVEMVENVGFGHPAEIIRWRAAPAAHHPRRSACRQSSHRRKEILAEVSGSLSKAHCHHRRRRDPVPSSPRKLHPPRGTRRCLHERRCRGSRPDRPET